MRADSAIGREAPSTLKWAGRVGSLGSLAFGGSPDVFQITGAGHRAAVMPLVPRGKSSTLPNRDRSVPRNPGTLHAAVLGAQPPWIKPISVANTTLDIALSVRNRSTVMKHSIRSRRSANVAGVGHDVQPIRA